MVSNTQIEEKGSPIFNYSNSAQVTDAIPYIETFESNAHEQTYLPFTTVRVINNSLSNSFIFYPNSNLKRGRLVKPNSSIILSNTRVDRWTVLASSSLTISIGEVQIEAEVTAVTQDDLARKKVKLFNFFGSK